MKGSMALDKASIVEQLSNATVIEIAELVKELENKWGVTAAAPVAVAAAAPAAGGAAAPAAAAKDTFDVILASVPADKKIAVRIAEAEEAINASAQAALAEIEAVSAEAAQEMVARISGAEISREAAAKAVKAALSHG